MKQNMNYFPFTIKIRYKIQNNIMNQQNIYSVSSL